MESEFSVPLILRLGIVGACIVGLDNTSPGTVALHQVGHCVKIVPADFVTSVLEFVLAVVGMDCQTGTERGVCTDEFSLGIQLRRKDLLKGHIRSRRLLEKGVAEFEVAAGRSGKERGSSHYICKYLFHHQNVILMPKLKILLFG